MLGFTHTNSSIKQSLTMLTDEGLDAMLTQSHQESFHQFHGFIQPLSTVPKSLKNNIPRSNISLLKYLANKWVVSGYGPFFRLALLKI